MVQRHKTPLSVSHPDASATWHPDKNDGLLPQQVVAGSNKKAWWKCTEGPDHEWEAPINRLAQGHGCPFCSGHRVSTTNSLKIIYPDLADQWHPSKNGDLTPELVVAGSHKKAWWKCPKGPDHEWQAEIVSRASGGRGCPFCRGFSVSVTNSLRTVSEELSSEWHPTNN